MIRDFCNLTILLCTAALLVGCRGSKSSGIQDTPPRATSASKRGTQPSPQRRDLLERELEQERRKREAAEKLISELEGRLATSSDAPSRARSEATRRRTKDEKSALLQEKINDLKGKLALQTQRTRKAEASLKALQKRLDEEVKARKRAEPAPRRSRSNAEQPQTKPSEAGATVRPVDVNARNLLSRVLILANDLYADKNYEIAAPLFRMALDNGVRDGVTYFRLGKCLAKLDKTNEAIEAYQSACECFETDAAPAARSEYHAYAYNSLGVLLRRKEDYAEAARAYEKAVEIMPTYAGAFYNLGVLYSDFLNDSERAARCFRKHIELGGEKAADAQRYLDQIEKKGDK